MKRILEAALLCGLASAALAQDKSAGSGEKPYAPDVKPASDEPLKVMKTFQIPKGFQIECFAAEPRVAEPVCFWIARNGDVYVAETFRHHAGVTDIRDHMDWLDDDVASRTVEDRVAMYRKHLGADFPTFETEHDRVHLLRDTDGDGKADWDKVFADRFHDAAAGIGAGLLENKGDVYYTCIPNFWRLRDTNGDGQADEYDLLSTGWGLRVALLGHDMHGIQIGPDGKLYWSIGDRGFHATTKEGKFLDSPFTGAVLRSNLDGSQMEIFATGLRNPQELCFDDFGNLWTGDNNSDGGDEARWVLVVEAGETGWRQAYQWLNEPNNRGPWNDERLWLPNFDGQAAYVVPPVANVANGPSGVTCYPGTGMPPEYAGHFFLCNFSGSPDWSGVYTFDVKPKGAGFEVGKVERFVWGPLATDCDFGWSGGLYVSDWVEGWNKTGKGRIWRVFEPNSSAAAVVKQTRQLMREGLKPRANEELAELMAHADRRVRRDAQFELVERGVDGRKLLVGLAHAGYASILQRLHAIWGLGMCVERDPSWNPEPLIALLSDRDPEVRAQAARVCGDRRVAGAAGALLDLLRDPSPRVRMLAAIGLARLKLEKAVEPALALLREVKQSDPWLRHAATYLLWSSASEEKIATLASEPSVDVRVAAVVALRRLKSAKVERFLEDKEPRVRAEAARAIYDVQLAEAMPKLADQITRGDLVTMDVRVPTSGAKDAFQAGNGLVRRVLNANFRLGGAERARALALFATNDKASPAARHEALDLLARWKTPPGRDVFCGEWMPLAARDEAPVAAAAREIGPALCDGAPAGVLRAWIRLAAELHLSDASPRLTQMALDEKRDVGVRAESLRALGKLKPQGVVGVLKRTLFDAAPDVRAAALFAFQEIAPDEALPLLEGALSGSVVERRVAYTGLAKLKMERVDELFLRELQSLQAGSVPPEVALDLVLAGEKRKSKPIQDLLAARKASAGLDPKLAPYADCLQGGDAQKGRDIFRGKSECECLRCHKCEEGDAGVVGPDMRGLGKRMKRLEILESILDPNKVLAQGYQGTIVFVQDGPPVEGTVIADTATMLGLRKSDGSLVEIQKKDVEGTKAGLSAMPTNMAEHLSREEMRDLVEYLSHL